MPRTIRTGRPTGSLCDLAEDAGSRGEYENIRNEQRAGRKSFGRLKAELQLVFMAPDTSYRVLTSADVIARNEV